jgi:hypothetical protein
MPVTDLTDSLPWWAQQGGGPPGGGQQPPGGGNSAGWLQYLAQMFGISPAEAAEGPQPRPAVGAAAPPVQLPGATPALPPGTTMPPTQPPAPLQQQGPPGYLNSTSAVPPIQPPTAGGFRPPNTANLPPGALNPTILGSYYNMPTPSGGGGGAALAALPAANPNAPATNAQPTSAAPPVAGPLAAGGAGGMGAASNPRFVEIARPNADPIGGAQGRGGPPRMTALNLAGLFGGGPQGGPAAAPQGVAGPLAGGSTRAGNFPYGKSTTPGGPFMPFDISGYPVAGVNAPSGGRLNPAVARARMLQPNYYS